MEASPNKRREQICFSSYTRMPLADLDRVTQERDALRSELAEAHNEIQRRKDDLIKIGARAEELQQRNDALLHSTSWR